MEFYQMEESNILRRVFKWMVDVVVVISLAWFVIYSFGAQVRIAGQSMMPRLADKDVVLVDRLSYDFGAPGRFDVVVFKREDDKSNVKRVIGLPGETVQIKEGFLYLDGKRLDMGEDFEPISLAGLAENPVVLEEEEYFLLGDNPDSSEDSRFANIGNVKRKQIEGKVWFRLMPLINMGFVK